MALDPTTMASTQNQIYTEETNLNVDGSVIYEEDEVTATPPPMPNNFASRLATAYNNYVKDGEVLGAVNEGGNPSILEAAFSALDNSSTSVDNLAAAFASFYSEVAIINGDPAHGGSTVISVENDAASRQSDFKAAIDSTYTQSEVPPPFSTFIQNIESAAKQIIWSVEEDTGVFPESIT
jgi:hypothetical protein